MNDINKFNTIESNRDTSLVLSERLVDSMFGNIKDGLSRTEKLTQNVGSTIIVISEKQDVLQVSIDKLENIAINHDERLTTVLNVKTNIIIEKLEDNTKDNIEDHKNINNIINIVSNKIDKIDKNIYKFMVFSGVINIVLGIITGILTWFIFFKHDI